ncbi:MAG: aquaporin [Syntrophobacteraceae bacterium]
MDQKWSSKYMREFIGTYLVVFIGWGTVFVAVYAGAFKDLKLVMFMWALAVAIPVHVGAAVSGAHFNPSVTIALAVWRGFPRSKVPAYLLSQLAGTFRGAITLIETDTAKYALPEFALKDYLKNVPLGRLATRRTLWVWRYRAVCGRIRA